MKVRDYFYDLPVKLDYWLRWRDFKRNRIEGTWLHKLGLIETYSRLAFWLPLPLIVVFAFGMPKWWRELPLLLLCLLGIAVHIFFCWRSKGGRLPIYQWLVLVLVTGIALALGFSAGGVQADSKPYAHLFGLFGIAVLTLGIPFSRWWADFLIGRERAWFRSCFAGWLRQTQLLVTPPKPISKLRPQSKLIERRSIRLLRALVLALFSSPLMLAILPAMVVLVLGGPDWSPVTSIVIVLGWLLLLTASHYRERLKIRELVREALLSGGTTVVSLVVILLAVTRLAGVSYLTTVLDQVSRWVVLGWILFAYLIFWLYDYWQQRAAAEVLLGLLHTGQEQHPSSIVYPYEPGATLSIHGAGRLIAVSADPMDGFEAQRPLEVFRKIVDQLEGRVRSAKFCEKVKDPVTWENFDDARQALDVLEEKVRIFHLVPGAILALLALSSWLYVSGLEQRPALTASATAGGTFDLGAKLAAASGETRYAVAASGGGTRAALYSYAVLRALHEAQALDDVVLLSSVSGGSAGVAYFAAHREALLTAEYDDETWKSYRDAIAADHIRRVLAGAGEWRFVEGTRLGQLLTESFERKFFPALCERVGCAGAKSAEGGPEIGVVFNTSLTGSWQERGALPPRQSEACWMENESPSDCATVDRTGSRLVITNLRAANDKSFQTHTAGWPLDFRYRVVKDPSASLAASASMSANFPPVFSNAAVDLNGGRAGAERYFVTDGGAVENRGLLSALLALLAEVGPMADGAGLPKFKVLVTEASGTSIAYGEDRGIGAVGSAKRQMANKLVAALGKVLEGEWRRVGGEGVSFEIVYLPMPEVLRTGFGTHWQLPAKVTLRDPETWFRDSSWLKFWKRKPETLTLKRDQLEWLIDELLARERTPYRPGEEEEKLWRWLTTGAHGDPRCALFKAVGGQAEGCD